MVRINVILITNITNATVLCVIYERLLVQVTGGERAGGWERAGGGVRAGGGERAGGWERAGGGVRAGRW
jgi:hypothetical protein